MSTKQTDTNNATDATLSPLLGLGPEAASGGQGEPEGGTLAGLEGLSAEITRRPRVSAQSVLLAVVVVVAGGVLFAMRQIGLGPASAIAQTKDAEIPMPSSGDHRGVLADLNTSRVDLQVPEANVKKNPFRLVGAAMEPEVAAPGATTDEASRRAGEAARADAEKRRKQAEARAGLVKSKLNGMTLNGVMGGSNPVARVNGRVYRTGDVVDELFTVREIRQRAVDLECDGITYTIEMATAEGKP
ncbi:MAG: hypothetical protein KIT68_06700 [Phycisphaeraceae bacterium]|nr:hypothetical protein [Phycisphaeraceae bacterium]